MDLAGWYEAVTSLLRTAPSQKEKSALRGTAGTPSADNRYVTEDDERPHASTHEPEGSDVIEYFPLLSGDPGAVSPSTSPPTDSVWFIRNGTSPESVSLRAYIDGDFVTLETWTV